MEDRFNPRPILTLFDKVFETKESIVEPKIVTRGSTVLIGGLTKIGKTMITLEFSRALSTATPLFGESTFHVPKRKRVLVLEQEIGEEEFQIRGKKAFQNVDRDDLDGFYFISKLPEMKLDSHLGRDIIENAIEQSKAEVVIIDPLSRFHNQEENSNTEIGKIFDVIDLFKRKRPDLAIILLHHFGKPFKGDNYDPLDFNNFRGAGKFISVVDAIISLHKMKDYRVHRDDGTFYDWWNLKARTTLRHGNKIDDYILSVNKADTLSVEFERWAEPRPIIVKPNPPKPKPPDQIPLAIEVNL